MNTLQEMIDVMTAARDGKEIECRQRGGDGWVSTNRSLYFNWVDYTYRVKPEPPKPREFYANAYGDGTFGNLWKTYEAAREAQDICKRGAIVIKLIEVL